MKENVKSKLYKLTKFSLTSLLMLTSLTACNKTEQEIENTPEPTANATAISVSNEKMNDTIWYNDNDNSALVFADDTHFVWYGDSDYQNSQNYMAGSYEFYDGQNALELISTIYENEEMPEISDQYSLLILTILTASNNGEEQITDEPVTKYYFGYKDDSIMSVVDLDSLNQYDFYADIAQTTYSQQLAGTDTIDLISQYDDITVSENTDIWKDGTVTILEHEYTYPFTVTELVDNGLLAGEIDTTTGKVSVYNEDGTFELNGRLKGIDDERFKILELDLANYGEYIKLSNDITKGSTIKDILQVYGNPNEYEIDENGIETLAYTCEPFTMSLQVYGKQSYSQSGLFYATFNLN